MGSSTIGFGVADRLDHRLAPGRGKRHFLAVDRVRLAVEDSDLEVLDLVAGDDAILERLADALLDRRHEDAGDHAALDHVDELEAFAAALRLDAQMHLAELAGATRLLLVAVHRLGRGGNGLAIGNARRPGVNLELVLGWPCAPAWPSGGFRRGRG